MASHRLHPILNPRVPTAARPVLRCPVVVYALGVVAVAVILNVAGVPPMVRFSLMVVLGINATSLYGIVYRRPFAVTARTPWIRDGRIDALVRFDCDLRKLLRRAPRSQRRVLRAQLDTLSWTYASLLHSDFVSAADAAHVERRVERRVDDLEAQLHQLWCDTAAARAGIDAATARVAGELDDEHAHPPHVTAELVAGATGADRAAVERYIEHLRDSPYGWTQQSSGRFRVLSPNTQTFSATTIV